MGHPNYERYITIGWDGEEEDCEIISHYEKISGMNMLEAVTVLLLDSFKSMGLNDEEAESATKELTGSVAKGIVMGLAKAEK